jgi:thymidylate synthase (FAD)
MSELTKNIVWDDVKHDPNAVKVLDHGFVVLKETMGSDSSIAESARVSYGAGTKTISDDRNLIRYLMRHHHTSPFEMAEARFLVKVPVFIWRQWIRHRTANVNELSGRYSELPEEFFVPEEWRTQSVTNKQGSEEPMYYKPDNVEDAAFAEYRRRLNEGVSRELARTCLPVSHYTLAYWKCDIHNILHFLRLRMHSHAQYEIQMYAQSIYTLLKEKFPLTFEAFEDYVLNCESFSRMELHLLKELLKNNKLTIFTEARAEDMGMSRREYVEFSNKILKISNFNK